MVVVPTLAAEVSHIDGNYCLFLPKAELFFDCVVLFLLFFPPPSSYLCPCGWYACKLPNSVPLPLGIHSEAERELLHFLCFSGIVEEVFTPWEAPAVALRLTAHLVSHRSLWTGSRFE